MKLLRCLLILISSLFNAQSFNIKIESFDYKESKLIINYSIQNLLNRAQYLVVNPKGFETYFDIDEYSYNLENFNEKRKNLLSPRIVLYDEHNNIVKVDLFSLSSPVDSIEKKMINKYNSQLKKKKEYYLPFKRKFKKPFGWIEIHETINNNILNFEAFEKKTFIGAVDLDKFIYDPIFKSNETFNMKENETYSFSLKLKQDANFLKEFIDNKKVNIKDLNIISEKQSFIYRKVIHN